MLTSSWLTLYGIVVVVPVVLVVILFLRGQKEKSVNDQHVGEHPLAPRPPHTYSYRMHLSQLLHFEKTAVAHYEDAIVDGRLDDVQWMAESGYLQAARDRAQQAK